MWTGTRLDWFAHQVTESDFLAYVRREARVEPERLMEFQARGTGRRVIGLWLNRLRGLVVELASYHPVSDPASREHVDQVCFNLNNTRRVRALQDTARKFLSAEYSHRERWAQAEAERDDYRKWFVNKHVPNQDRRKDPRWLAAL